jgi:SAM-dependent methyltransferase
MKLFLNADNRGDHRVYDPGDGRETLEVPAMPLANILADRGLSPRLVKIDVQGWEPRVLGGALPALRGARPLVLITEFWTQGLVAAGSSAIEYLSMIDDLKLDLYEIDAWKGGIVPVPADRATLLTAECDTNLLGLRGVPLGALANELHVVQPGRAKELSRQKDMSSIEPTILVDLDGAAKAAARPELRSGLLRRVAFRVLTGNAAPSFDEVKLWDVMNVERLLSSTDRKARLLDCGGFNSPCLRALSLAGFTNLYGIDLNPSLTAQATPWKTTLTVQDMQATTFASCSFDVLISCSTIEHGVSWPRFLAEAARLLRPGGLLYLSTDLVHDDAESSSCEAFGLPWWPLRAGDLPGTIQLLDDCGFEPPPVLWPIELPAALPYEFLGVPLAFIALVTVKRQ